MSKEARRIRVATTRTNADNPDATGAAVYVLNAEAQTFNDEEEAFLSEKEWRCMFVEFPQYAWTTRSVPPDRRLFPEEIPWVDLSDGFLDPPNWIPSLVAIRGTVLRFDIDTKTGEEEVDIGVELIPADSDLLDILKRRAVADVLFKGCLRAVNLFPRGKVEKGASFTAYLSMAYQRIPATREIAEKYHLTKVVWDLQVNGSQGKQTTGTLSARIIHEAWKRLFTSKSVWAPSEVISELYSPCEASLVMDLHFVLMHLWHARFGHNEALCAQLRAQANDVNKSGVVRPVFGKSAHRKWKGHNLFQKP